MGILHFVAEYAIWDTAGFGVGIGMAVGVPAISLIWMVVGWVLGWYVRCGRTILDR